MDRDAQDSSIAADFENRPELTIDEIAAVHDVSRHRVKAVASERGLKRTRGRRSAVDEEAIVNDYLHSDMTVAAIAEHHGVSSRTVDRIRSQRKLPPRGHDRGGPTRTLDHDAIARDYAATTDSVVVLAVRHRCSPATIAGIATARRLRRPVEVWRTVDHESVVASFRNDPTVDLELLAKDHGCTQRHVRKLLRRAGFQISADS